MMKQFHRGGFSDCRKSFAGDRSPLRGVGDRRLGAARCPLPPSSDARVALLRSTCCSELQVSKIVNQMREEFYSCHYSKKGLIECFER